MLILHPIKYRNIRIIASPKHAGAYLVKYDESTGADPDTEWDVTRSIPCHNYATALWEVRNLKNQSS
mgnify:FL=1